MHEVYSPCGFPSTSCMIMEMEPDVMGNRTFARVEVERCAAGSPCSSRIKSFPREFGVSDFPPRSPRYNIAPSQPVAAVRAAPAGSGRELALLRWGLIPSWSKDPAIGNRLINARAETASEKPSFRNAFKTASLPDPRQRILRVAAMGAWETAVLRPDA